MLIAVGLLYFLLTVLPGIGYLRRPPQRSMSCPEFAIYALVPCLNEAQVIGTTVRRLTTDPRVRVIVIDDGSDDDTAAVAQAAAPGQVLVVRRTLPQARQGKGPALNFGLALLEKDVMARRLDPDRVLVCVMDADGRLSEGTFGKVVPLFADHRVGGVQLAVRIRNRHMLLTRIQDVEFWGASAVSQFGRIAYRSVSLGGNGQFTRLTALQALGRPTWNPSLTEDLDLAVSLAVAGWRLTSTTEAYVDQQGVETLGRLVRQRTRWFQGHMHCGARLGELWRSRRASHATVLEMTLYLLSPWALVLPWSVMFHLSVLEMVVALVHYGPAGLFGPHLGGLAVLYAVSFAPFLIAGLLYRSRDPSQSGLRAIVLGHLLLPASYITYAAAWLALFRLLTGRHGWAKTARDKEVSVDIST